MLHPRLLLGKSRTSATSAYLCLVAASVLLGLSAAAHATGSSPAEPASSLLAPGASWQKVIGDLRFSEGPAWHPDGFLLFEDVPADRTMILDAKGKVSVFRSPTNHANGLSFDGRNRLVACEGNAPSGGRRVVRIARKGKGKVEVLAEGFDGKRFNSPNDLAIDQRGRIYFTDPRYSKRETMEMDVEAVYRIDPDKRVTRIIDSLTRPNGILVTPDSKTLYVADNASPGGVVTLWGFDLDRQGNAGNGRILYDFREGRGIDGMALDAEGRIWATAGTKDKAGIYVFRPDAERKAAELVQMIPTAEDPTNVTFGGKKRDILYVTTTASLLRIQTTVRGQPSPPGK